MTKKRETKKEEDKSYEDPRIGNEICEQLILRRRGERNGTQIIRQLNSTEY
jgi:hypothetical protein